jgi:hypothetical protein
MKIPWWKLAPERRKDTVAVAGMSLVVTPLFLAIGRPWVGLGFFATGIARLVQLYRTRCPPDGSNPQE